MPLPNNPYPNKLDLVYVCMLEIIDRVRGGVSRLSRLNFKLLLMLQSSKQEQAVKEQQHHA